MPLTRAATEAEQQALPRGQPQTGLALHYFVARGDVDGVVEVEGTAFLLRDRQSQRQVRYLDEAEARGDVPQTAVDVPDLGAARLGDTRHLLEDHLQVDRRLLQRLELGHVVQDHRRDRESGATEKHRRARHARNVALVQLVERPRDSAPPPRPCGRPRARRGARSS